MFVQPRWRDLPRLFWSLLMHDPEAELRAAIERERDRYADLLAKHCELAIEAESMRARLDIYEGRAVRDAAWNEH